jgi:hypothetical protein
MADRLSQEITLLLAEHDDRPDDLTGVRDLVRARLAISLSEGLGNEADVLRDGAAGADDLARLAAFFDDGLPRPDRDVIVAARVNDPTCRADLSSAAVLLDSIEVEPGTLPAGLLARAVDTFAPAPSPHRQSAVQRQPSVSWRGQRIFWPSLAALLLVAALTPAVLPVLWDKRDASPQDATGGAIGRGVAPLPKADKTCEPAKADPRSGEAKGAQEGATVPSPDATPDDPCVPKPPTGDGQTTKPPLPGARN